MGHPLMEEFRKMGMTDKEAEDSVANVIGDVSEGDESEFDEDEDLEEDEDDLEEDEDLDEDVLTILEAYKKARKLRGKEKIAAKKFRKSAAGKSAARKAAKAAKRPSAKRRLAKRRKKLAKMGDTKKGFRRVLPSWIEPEGNSESIHESCSDLIENLNILAEAIQKDPTDRFSEFAEAFNHLADIGEIMTLRYHDLEEDELAQDSYEMAARAEEVLEYMESLGGALSLEEDEELEAALAAGMEEAAGRLSEFDELMEQDDDEDDDEDEDEDDDDEEYDEETDLVSLARQIAEAAKVAKGKGKLHGKAAKKIKKKKRPVKGTIKKKTKGLSKFEKGLVKDRKDIKDPEKLGGFLRWYDPNDRSED